MLNLPDEFERRLSVLKGAHFDDLSGRLVGILDWLAEQPATKRILDYLENSIDFERLFAGTGARRAAPKTNTVEEVAAVGMALIEMCRKQDFYNLCVGYNIRPRGNSNNLGDISDEGLSRFVFPFFNYVANELERQARDFAPAVVIEQKVATMLSSPLFARDFPETRRRFDTMSREFLRPDEEVDWQNIANSCRQTLIDFVREIRGLIPIEGIDDTKSSDLKSMARHVIRAAYGTGKFSETLENLIRATWDHVQSVIHRGATTKDQALRVYISTALVVDELAHLVQAALRT
jgi:hypothetical protein